MNHKSDDYDVFLAMKSVAKKKRWLIETGRSSLVSRVVPVAERKCGICSKSQIRHFQLKFSPLFLFYSLFYQPLLSV